MRCKACNVVLTEFESVRKDTNGEYTDLCSLCLSTLKDTVFTYSRNQDSEEDELEYGISTNTDLTDSIE